LAFLIADKTQQRFFQKIANDFLAGNFKAINSQILEFIKQNQDQFRS
jgi:hypothetical protein